MFSPTAQKLLIVGELLGEAGDAFTREGKRLERRCRDVIPEYVYAIRTSVNDMSYSFGRRHEVAAAKIKEQTDAVLGQDSFDESSITIRELDTWVIEELLALPLSPEVRKTNCTFCGARSTERRKLLACARCKSALYCDRTCQKMDFKQRHKANCTAKAKEGNEAEVEAS
ncbi:hypothetical protein TI39_contig412g00032 [Zymoseptoria brevis]|uniref:MYND-type domain-containing protein n=1 Tax=Zymoseptoria brevis TaxID=1047168 RepID=A0A0F4GLY7_9PEZI|nr:hypothetical protein TI39_contig412g00032 [Zymoseptoria brevis]